jgi:hypothetical protein
MRGKDISIPKGTEITAYIDGDREFALAAPSVEPAAALPNATQFGTVTFRSEPDGADITIDGKFVGSTPSSLQLTAGDHTIAIEKAHFSSVAAGSSANVGATLDKTQWKSPHEIIVRALRRAVMELKDSPGFRAQNRFKLTSISANL